METNEREEMQKRLREAAEEFAGNFNGFERSSFIECFEAGFDWYEQHQLPKELDRAFKAQEKYWRLKSYGAETETTTK